MSVYDQAQSFNDSLDMQVYEPVSVEERFAGHSVQRHTDNRNMPQLVGAICCAVLAIVCLSGFSYVVFLQPAKSVSLLDAYKQSAQGGLDDNRAVVSLPLYVPDMDNRSSRVPISITGTMANGEEVNKETYVAADGSGLRLEPGTYEATVIGMPINSYGVVYINPTAPISIEVSEDFLVTCNASSYLTFAAIGALEMTDQQIEDAIAFVRADPERTQYATQLEQAAHDRRDEAIKEQEAAKKAREEAERTAADANVTKVTSDVEKDKQQNTEQNTQSESEYNQNTNNYEQDNNGGSTNNNEGQQGGNNNNNQGQNDSQGTDDGGSGGNSGDSGTTPGGGSTDGGSQTTPSDDGGAGSQTTPSGGDSGSDSGATTGGGTEAPVSAGGTAQAGASGAESSPATTPTA